MRRPLKTAAFLMVLLLSRIWASAAQQDTPQNGQATMAVQAMVEAAKKYDAEKEAGRDGSRARISAILDLHEMARLILARNWDRQKPAEREKYAALMTALVEKIGYPQIGKLFNSRIEMNYTGEKPLEAGKTAVFTSIRFEEDDTELHTEFRLHSTGTGWRIYDVITDGESLLLIYRNQHAGIIKEKGFPNLIKLMEKKLNGS